MNPALKLVAGILTVILGFLFVSYGAVTPCGILKKEMRSAVLRKALEKQETETNDWGKAGIGLGMALGGPMIDSMVDGLTPMQCARAIINIATQESSLEKSPWPFSGSSSSRTNTTPLTEAGQDAEYEAVRKQDTIQAYQDFLYRKKAHDKHYAEALARLDEYHSISSKERIYYQIPTTRFDSHHRPRRQRQGYLHRSSDREWWVLYV